MRFESQAARAPQPYVDALVGLVPAARAGGMWHGTSRRAHAVAAREPHPRAGTLPSEEAAAAHALRPRTTDVSQAAMLLLDGGELEGVALRAVEDARRLQLAHLAACAYAWAGHQSNVCASRGAGRKGAGRGGSRAEHTSEVNSNVLLRS